MRFYASRAVLERSCYRPRTLRCICSRDRRRCIVCAASSGIVVHASVVCWCAAEEVDEAKLNIDKTRRDEFRALLGEQSAQVQQLVQCAHRTSCHATVSLRGST